MNVNKVIEGMFPLKKIINKEKFADPNQPKQNKGNLVSTIISSFIGLLSLILWIVLLVKFPDDSAGKKLGLFFFALCCAPCNIIYAMIRLTSKK